MDDEPDIRIALARLLNYSGYVTSVACEGEEAIKLFSKARKDGTDFDAVILDLNIQDGLSGKETFKRLKEIEPDVKAVVCSGHIRASDIPYYISLGFKGVLIKPYKYDELVSAVTDAIGQS
jgi:DNA-binding NtrC family response regulator